MKLFEDKIALVALLSGVLGIGALWPAPAVEPQEEALDGIIIKYRDEALKAKTPATLTAEIASKRAVALTYKRAMSGQAHVLKLATPKKVSEVKAIAEALARDPQVLYAEPDYVMQPLFTPNDTQYSSQWHYYEATGGLNLPSAWNKSTGSGAVVAVIDTGYRPHADLASNILSGYDFITDGATANDSQGTNGGRDSDAKDPGDGISQEEFDFWFQHMNDFPPPPPLCAPGALIQVHNSSWHGTHVSGTIAAKTNNASGVAGVAFNAKIVPVRVLGRCGGATSDIIDGMRWAAGLVVSGVSANQNPADVINMSLGGSGSCSQAFADAVDDVRAQGTTIVVSAGNSNANVSNTQPASCSGVIAVAATNRAGSKAFYSNFGALVAVAAPGGETSVNTSDGVLSTLNAGAIDPGADSYVYYQGTSMAAPHVSGAAALLYSLGASIGPAMTPDTIEEILMDSARAFPGTCTNCGTGIVDANAALNAIYTPWILPRLMPAILGVLE